jgi:Family of unknown function (DUF6526)
MSEPQNFANHGKIVRAFHFFIVPVLAINLVIHIYQLFRLPAFSPLFVWRGIFGVLLAAALLTLAFLGRLFALGVQDRVIRLEERLRYQQLLPDDLQPQIKDFTISQLVALRFAGDAELPVLARKVLNDNIGDRKTIKRLIQSWRADYQRI